MIQIDVQKIRLYLKAQGLTQAALAEKMDLAESSLSAMLSGKRRMPAEIYLAICQALNQSVSSFAVDEERH